MSKYGWTCSVCTFYHHAPAYNCGMCGNPRVTKTQMRDFILGKPIPDDSAASPTRKVPPEALAQKTIAPIIQSDDASKSKLRSITKTTLPKRPRPDNPYKKKASSVRAIVAPMVDINNNRPICNQKPASSMPESTNPPFATSALSHQPSGVQRNIATTPSQPFTNASSRNNRTTTNRKDNISITNGMKPSQKPTNAIHNAVYQPGPVPICPETSCSWIYPNDPNYPKRSYQFHMTQTSLFHNTVC